MVISHFLNTFFLLMNIEELMQWVLYLDSKAALLPYYETTHTHALKEAYSNDVKC